VKLPPFWQQSFVWGQKPPKWFMREVSRAFEYMGKNREAAHIFDCSDRWSVVLLMVERTKAPELAEYMVKWYMQTYGGEAGDWPLKPSERPQ
jgi:hypothetical protein